MSDDMDMLAVDPLIVRLPDGPYRWIDLRVGSQGEIDAKALVRALAGITDRPLEVVSNEEDGGFILRPGDPTPGVALLVGRLLRILAQTAPRWVDVDLLALAHVVEAAADV
jgi:hypothetical protein